MAVTSGFFNSVNHDRLYDAEQLSSIFDGVILDGVFEAYGDALEVAPYADANNTVIVKTGRAWFDHTWTLNDTDFQITLPNRHSLYSRTDAIVLDVNRERTARINTITYVIGDYEYAEVPAQRPQMIKSEFHNQYPLAFIRMEAGEDRPIQRGDIQIMVGTDLCPFVTGPLEVMNSDMFFTKFEDKFNEWFNGLKVDIDENAAVNLYNKIEEVNDRIDGLNRFGIEPEKYEFANNCSIRVFTKMYPSYDSINNGSLMSSSVHTRAAVLPDGYTLIVSNGYRSMANPETNDFTGIYADIVDFDGVGNPIKIADKKYATDSPYGSMALLFANADSYPANYIFADIDVAETGVFGTQYDTVDPNLYCSREQHLMIINVTVTSDHVVSCTETWHTIPQGTGFTKLTNDGSYANLNTYLTDYYVPRNYNGDAILVSSYRYNVYGDAERHAKSDDNLTIYRVNSEGSVVAYNKYQNLPVNYDDEHDTSYIFNAYSDILNGWLIVRNPRSNNFSSSPGPHHVFRFTLTNLAFIDETYVDTEVPNVGIYNDTYTFLNSRTITKMENSVDIKNGAQESVPPTISLIFDIAANSSGGALGYTSGFVSKDKSIMLVNNASNSYISSLLGDSGLSVWSAPGSSSDKWNGMHAAQSVLDGSKKNINNTAFLCYPSLFNKAQSGSSLDNKKFVFIKQCNFYLRDVSSSLNTGHLPPVLTTGGNLDDNIDYRPIFMYVIEKGE